MDNFTTAELSFPGLFVSGGIIPDFRYEAKIMDDYSLGFDKPMAQYPMYGGKGSGDIAVKLSEEGFTAKGTIDFQGAVVNSEEILMTPDYTSAVAKSYEVKENSKYPNVLATADGKDEAHSLATAATGLSHPDGGTSPSHRPASGRL